MKRRNKVVEEVRVTASELADMFDLTVARIGQLDKAGVLEKGDDNHFDLQISIVSYGRYLLAPRLFDAP